MLPALTSHGTIKRWFTSVRAWRLRKKIRYLASWEQERAKGKARFIVRTALIYSLIMTAAQDVLGYGFDAENRLSKFLFNAVFYSLGGVFVGYIAWAAREMDYQNALREIRIETIAAGEPPIDNQEEQLERLPHG